MEIWEERVHRCENCGIGLNPFKTKAGLPLSKLFSHRRPKSVAPELRWDKRNIDLLCPECHRQWEFGDRKSMRIWKKDNSYLPGDHTPLPKE